MWLVCAARQAARADAAALGADGARPCWDALSCAAVGIKGAAALGSCAICGADGARAS